MRKGMTIIEMMIVVAVMAFFILGIASPFLVGTRDEAMNVMAKNMEGDLNTHYNHWLSAGGIIEGRPKTSDLLALFTSAPGVNQTVQTQADDDKTSAVKDGGYSNLLRLSLPDEIKPAANAPSKSVVASENYVVQFNNDTGQFSVSSMGGSGSPPTPTTGGTNPPGPTIPPEPPIIPPDPPEPPIIPPVEPPTGGTGPTKPNEPFQQEGEFSAYTWVAPKGTPSPYVYTSIRIPAYAPTTHAAQSKQIKDGHVALFFTTSGQWMQVHQNAADKIKNPDGTPTTYQDVWMNQGIKDIRDGTDPNTSGTGSTAQGVDEWFRHYAGAGGKANYIVADWEGFYDVPGPGWGIDLDKAAALYSDPRFGSIAGSLPASVSSLGPGTANIPTRQQYVYTLTGIALENFGQAVLQPARKYFPQSRTSNYMSFIMTPNNSIVWNNGSTGTYFLKKAGTDNAPSLYGGVYTGFVDTWGNKSFIRVLWLTNFHRSIQRSSSDPITPWMAPCSFSSNGCPALAMPYYKEIVYHFALSGANAIFVWNPFASQADDEGFGDAMNNVNSKLGAGWRYPLTIQNTSMSSNLIVSGMKVEGGKTLYRVTVKKDDADLSVVKTVQVSNGNVLTVPAGEVGVWYESSTGEQVTFSE